MSPKVYLQRVVIYWTKKSRGMPGAAKRNSCKICYPILDNEIEALTAGESYSSVIIHESAKFTPRQTTEKFWRPGKLDFETISIKRPAGKVVVRYRYSTLFVGAPDRSHRPDISCEIGRENWPEWNTMAAFLIRYWAGIIDTSSIISFIRINWRPTRFFLNRTIIFKIWPVSCDLEILLIEMSACC
jgi:hypothetical protein